MTYDVYDNQKIRTWMAKKVINLRNNTDGEYIDLTFIPRNHRLLLDYEYMKNYLSNFGVTDMMYLKDSYDLPVGVFIQF